MVMCVVVTTSLGIYFGLVRPTLRRLGVVE